jgi:hypothetical protein
MAEPAPVHAPRRHHAGGEEYMITAGAAPAAVIVPVR